MDNCAVLLFDRKFQRIFLQTMEEKMRFCMDLCLAVVLIQIAWTDIRTMMIPDRGAGFR